MVSSSDANVRGQATSSSGPNTYEQVVGPYNLYKNSSNVYVYRVWADPNGGWYDDTDTMIESQMYVNLDPSDDQVAATNVYPNPDSTSTSNWSISIAYKAVSFTYNFTTTQNSYTNSGNSWFVDLFNNYAPSTETYQSDGTANGWSSRALVYAGPNATTGLHTGTANLDIEDSQLNYDAAGDPYYDNFWVYNSANWNYYVS